MNQRIPFRSFSRDEQGGIVLIFALTLVAVCGFIGLAIDGGRAMSAHNKAGAALDAAALATTRELIQTGATDAELQTLASTYFEANAEQGVGLIADYRNVQVAVNRGTKTLTVSADIHVNTTFAKVIGVDAFDFSASSTASFNVKDIELGMALDVTGSMGGQKIEDLKTAAKNLVDMLIPDDGSVSDVSVGAVAYSGAVRLPASLARAASNNTSSACVIERRTADRYTDNPATPTSFFVRYSGPNCPAPVAQGLTRDKDALKSMIDSFAAGGPTAGHIGIQWAWNAISPNWAGLWPNSLEAKAYNTPDLVKAVIIMTDGEFNTQYANDTSTAQARALCDGMKAENILVYTVSFQNPNHPDLQYCASTDPVSGERLYFEAEDGDALNAAFRSIAVKLTNLRLSQ